MRMDIIPISSVAMVALCVCVHVLLGDKCLSVLICTCVKKLMFVLKVAHVPTARSFNLEYYKVLYCCKSV